jgi:5-methylthioadenosine/S-adenosylhomocysteine deaminase
MRGRQVREVCLLTDSLTRPGGTGESQWRTRDGHRLRVLVSETHGHARDAEDARRMSHNPEVAGSNPAPATKGLRFRALSAYAQAGLLGPDINFVHGNQLTSVEWSLIADSCASLAICPSIDMLMALGTYPATGFALANGIPAGLSVDATTGTGTDLFSEMRLALAAERSRANAAEVGRDEAVAEVQLDHRDMLRLATFGGAHAWRIADQVGSLTPGKQADLVIVDHTAPHLDGFGDPVDSIVMGAGPADVETVVVGGEVVKAGGKLVGAHAARAADLMRASR